MSLERVKASQAPTDYVKGEILRPLFHGSPKQPSSVLFAHVSISLFRGYNGTLPQNLSQPLSRTQAEEGCDVTVI